MSKIRLNEDHLKGIDYKVTVPMIQCSECGQSVLDTPTNRANNLIHDAMCSKNPTPQPLGMSGDREEKWWNLEPYRNPRKYEDYETGGEVIGYEYDFSAILKEQRRLVLAEAREKFSDCPPVHQGNEILVKGKKENGPVIFQWDFDKFVDSRLDSLDKMG